MKRDHLGMITVRYADAEVLDLAGAMADRLRQLTWDEDAVALAAAFDAALARCRTELDERCTQGE